MTKKKIVVANWKMNPKTSLEARDLFKKVKLRAKVFSEIEVVICPPALYLPLFSKMTQKNFSLGVQNVFSEQSGSFTGEIGPGMAADAGASFVILGHSERRAMGETDQLVAKKVSASLSSGLLVVLCVGEKERDSSARFYEFLKNQIRTSLGAVKASDLKKIIIAYEPVWAIGKSFKDAMKPAELYEMTIFIKKVFADMFTADVAHSVRILYGGSVNFENAPQIIKEGGVQGLLVGRESLDAESFSKLLKAVHESR